MRDRFSLTRAARLAGLSLEVTNEAARDLHLKVSEDAAGSPFLPFKAVRILRDLAPALRRGVPPSTAYHEFNLAAYARLSEAEPCPITPLSPSAPNTGEAHRLLEEASELFFKTTSFRYEREINLVKVEWLLRRSIANDPTIAQTWSDLATVLWERSAPRATCAQLFRRALALDPDMVDALHAVGALELQEGRPAEALVLVAHACRVAPEEARFFELLAKILTALGRSTEAAQARATARELEETHRVLAAPG